MAGRSMGDLRDAARRLYVDRKLSIAETARRLKVSYSTGWKLLKLGGVSLRRNTRVDVAEARRLYVDKGWSLNRIGQRYGVSKQWIYDLLKAEGVEFRHRGRPEVSFDADSIIKYYWEGRHGLGATARRFRLPANRVRQLLLREGVQLRRGSLRRGRFDRIYKLGLGKSTIMPAPKLGYTRRYVSRIGRNTGRRFRTKKLAEDRLKITRVA